MGKSSKPDKPDAAATASQQAQYNKEAAVTGAEMSMINQNTPQGTLSYNQSGTSESGNPQYTATQSLNDKEQQVYDQGADARILYGGIGNDQLGRVKDTLSNPLDFGSLGAAPTPDEAWRTQVSNSMYDRINPQLDRDREALETKLINQGLQPGSEAYNEQYDQFNRQVADTRLAIDGQSGGEMARQYGFATDARDRGVNEMIQQRSVPLNELAALYSGSQVSNPSFVNTPQSQVASPDFLGATYQGYDTALGEYTKQRQGTFDLAGSAMKAGAYAWSDRRLKRNIIQIGKLKNGLPLYSFTYIWDGAKTQFGVMADEVKKIMPNAVKTVWGFDCVDYAKVTQ